MTIDEEGAEAPTDPSGGADGSDGSAVRDLLNGLTREPWGQTSPSVYETGRLVTLAPWLTGHAERVRYVLDGQRADGGWGAAEGYALVPTLSATEALITTLRRGDFATRPGIRPDEVADGARRGLVALFDLLSTPALAVPDTPAVELIVPALTASVNEHLDQLRDSPIGGLDAGLGERRLDLPPGMDTGRLTTIQRALAAGARVPEKLLHALEVVGDLARDARGVSPLPPGTIGGSPAATAAWIGDRARSGPADQAVTYLETTARRLAGPVPCATPITVFERAWVLSGLARVGALATVPPGLVRSLRASLESAGASAGPGLPADADTTSVVLYALTRLGVPVDPASLLAFDNGTHFCTWPGEDGFSVTTNAHVLDALGQHILGRAGAATRYRAALSRLSAWLPDQQDTDGGWSDRWHASPYYATVCCALALAEHGTGPAAAEAVTRAVDWVVTTQRADGSWGRWSGSVEETAYALQVLLGTNRPDRPGLEAAAARGWTYLRSAKGCGDGPPLWHDKDLYYPGPIVRATVLGAAHLARRGQI